MLHLLICEDDSKQRSQIESVVNGHIATEDCDIELTLSTGNLTEILDFLKDHPDKKGLYFLDVDLQHDIMNGIELGARVREADPLAKIVFVTTHNELAYLTFTHKVEAMDYIIKERPEDVELRVIECILIAYKQYLEEQDAQQKEFQFEIGGRLWRIPHDEILFFETDPGKKNKAFLHKKHEQIGLRNSMNNIAAAVPEFYRCHQSFLVNPKHIRGVDKISNEIKLSNGETIPFAPKKAVELTNMIKQACGPIYPSIIQRK